MSNFEKRGIPEDLLTAKEEGSRSLKVSLDASRLAESGGIALTPSVTKNKLRTAVSLSEIAIELRLLNARIEEAFETGIDYEDIS